MPSLQIKGLTCAAAAHVLRNCNGGGSVAIAAVADELDGIDPAETIPSLYVIASAAAEECAEADEPNMPPCFRPCVEREDIMRLGWGRTCIELRVTDFAPSPLYDSSLQPRLQLAIMASSDDLTPEQFAAHDRVVAARSAAEEMGRSHRYIQVVL